MLLPYTAFGGEDAVLTAALAAPAIVAVAVDAFLRWGRASRDAAGGAERPPPAPAAARR